VRGRDVAQDQQVRQIGHVAAAGIEGIRGELVALADQGGEHGGQQAPRPAGQAEIAVERSGTAGPVLNIGAGQADDDAPAAWPESHLETACPA
jgi:hypothetical protein